MMANHTIKQRGFDTKCVTAPCNQKGIALMIALVMLVMVTVIGLASIRTTTTEIKLGGNERVATESLYIAEAGIQHAVRALKIQGFNSAVTASNANGNWIVVDDFHGVSYTVNASTTNAAGISAPDGNTIFLTSTATYPSGFTKTIEAEVFNSAGQIPINYSVGAIGNFSRVKIGDTATVNGNLPDGSDPTIPAETVDTTGEDPCLQNKAGLAVDNVTSYENIIVQNNANVTGNPDMQLRPADMTPTQVWDLANDIATNADKTYTVVDNTMKVPGVQTWGTAGNPKVTVVSMEGDDSRIEFEGNISGYGVLVITSTALKRGRIEFDKNFEWHGLIIVTGDTEFRLRADDTAKMKVVGGMVAANTTPNPNEEQIRLRLKGETTMQYSCEDLKKATTFAPVKINSWHEIRTVS